MSDSDGALGRDDEGVMMPASAAEGGETAGRRLAALAYFTFPLAGIWGPLLIRALAKSLYSRRHAVNALVIQLAFGLAWIPLNLLIIFGVTQSFGLPALAAAGAFCLFSWSFGVLAWRGKPAPAFTHRWSGVSTTSSP